MKSLLWLTGGAAAAIAYLLISKPRAAAVKSAPVDDLAHKLQDAWADHHTVA